MGDAVAFIVENGRICILWMEDDLYEEIKSYYHEHRYAVFQMWQGNDSYRVTVEPERSVGCNEQTGEEYEVWVQSMRHTGPGG